MVPAIVASIMEALEEARQQKPSREMSLVITKLEEALMWYGQHERLAVTRP